MPVKKAKFKIHINQQLSGAIALGAPVQAAQAILRTAAGVLGISQSVLTTSALDKRASIVLGCLQDITIAAQARNARDANALHSTSAATCSGGVNWLMPWPRLKMCVGPVPRHRDAAGRSSAAPWPPRPRSARAARTARSGRGCPAARRPGRLAHERAGAAEVRPSSRRRPPRRRARASLRATGPPPLVKTMRGTGWPSAPSRFRPAEHARACRRG